MSYVGVTEPRLFDCDGACSGSSKKVLGADWEGALPFGADAPELGADPEGDGPSGLAGVAYEG